MSDSAICAERKCFMPCCGLLTSIAFFMLWLCPAQYAQRTSSHVYQMREQTPPEGGGCSFGREAAYSCKIVRDELWLDVSMQTNFALVVGLTAALTLIA